MDLVVGENCRHLAMAVPPWTGKTEQAPNLCLHLSWWIINHSPLAPLSSLQKPPDPLEPPRPKINKCQEQNLKDGILLSLMPAVNIPSLGEKVLELDPFSQVVGKMASCYFTTVAGCLGSGADLFGRQPQLTLLLGSPQAPPTCLPPPILLWVWWPMLSTLRWAGLVEWKSKWRWCLSLI